MTTNREPVSVSELWNYIYKYRLPLSNMLHYEYEYDSMSLSMSMTMTWLYKSISDSVSDSVYYYIDYTKLVLV